MAEGSFYSEINKIVSGEKLNATCGYKRNESPALMSQFFSARLSKSQACREDYARQSDCLKKAQNYHYSIINKSSEVFC